MLGLDWDLAPLPCSASQLDRRLEQRELVRPGAEAALASIAVELAEHGHHRVAGRLMGQIVEISAAQVRMRAAPAIELEACGAKEQLVQARSSLLTAAAVDGQTRYPSPRLGVGSAGRLGLLDRGHDGARRWSEGHLDPNSEVLPGL
jgi:hypothetical protein